MATRPNLSQQPVIGPGSPGNISGNMASNISSAITILDLLTVGSYTYSWSGSSPTGSISVQVSNDYALNPNGTVKNAGTWNPIYFIVNGGTTPVDSVSVSGNTGNGVIEWATGCFAIQTVYTASGGTGALASIFNGKVT